MTDKNVDVRTLAGSRLTFVAHAAFCPRCAMYLLKPVERRAAVKANEYALCKEGREILALCGDDDSTALGSTDAAAVQSVIDDVLAKKPGKLVDVEWRFDEDHTGDPCIKVRVVLSSYTYDGYHAVEREISSALRTVSDRFVYASPCTAEEREQARKKGQRLV